jgi:transglutaminase-like putative cysteine protease
VRLLTVRHITVYRYSEPVSFGEHRMMFRPRESHDLRLVSTRLDITPRPFGLRWLHDVFDNSVAIATFDGKASELRFDSTITLEQMEIPLPDYALESGAHTFPFHYSDDERPDLVNALARQYPADDIGPWVERFLTSSSGSTTTMSLLHSMTRGIKEEFTYLRRTEKGVQTPAETLRRRSGSCRDFAVLMMDAVRSVGLAARFVSGYIFVPQSGTASVGGGNTHAWMQAYLPGAGWVDFDPTNSIVGNRNLIRVAVAWDHRNAVPLHGTFNGPASAFLDMNVEVSVIEENVAA